MRLSVERNILGYAERVNGAAMKRAALELIDKLPQDTVFVPGQAQGELFSVLVRKGGGPQAKARRAILTWQDAFLLIETSAEVMLAATDLAMDHQFNIWDAMIFSAAAASACRLLLSEDLQEDFTWKGVSATNPSSARKQPLICPSL